MRFVGLCTTISRPERETMLYKGLSVFSQHVLPLPCNVLITVTSLWLYQRFIDTATAVRLSVCVHVSKRKAGTLNRIIS